MKYDAVSIGELLIDFSSSGMSAQGNPIFEANPGGGPCNALAMLAKLGKNTAFIGKVGTDMFGRMLRETLGEIGIDGAGLICDPSVNTTLAFVHNAPDGERDFSFFRKPGADMLLRSEEVNKELLGNCRIFQFSSVSMTHQPSRMATMDAVTEAKERGALIAFDPNLRPPLWESLEEAKRQIYWGCSMCDVLKVSEEELSFLGYDPLSGAAELLRKHQNIRLLLLTKGREGAEGFWGDYHVACPTFTDVKTIDTTGAGDSFFGCCLSFILGYNLDCPNEEALKEMIVFANAAASLITTKKGALRVMPGREEILQLLKC